MNFGGIISKAGHKNESFMPLSIATQIGGSNTRLVTQGFDPEDPEAKIVQRVRTFKANGHDPQSGLRSDLFTVKNIISGFTQRFNQFLEQFDEFAKLKTQNTRLPITIETAGFKASLEDVIKADIDSKILEQAYQNGSLKPEHTLFLPNVDAGNTVSGLDPRFFALDQFAKDFKQPNNKLELESKEISPAQTQLTSTLAVTNINDCQAGSRAVASQLDRDGLNNLHVILGTGANIFIGENFSTAKQSYQKEVNTEHGHVKPFKDDELTFLESWRKEKGLKTTFEELFAGGSDADTQEDDPSYYRGIKGLVRHVRSLPIDGFTRQHLGLQLQEIIELNSLDDEGDFVIDLNPDPIIPAAANLNDYELISSSRIFQLDDTEITPRKIDDLAKEGDDLALALIKYQAIRLAQALYKLHGDQLEKTDILSFHGSTIVKSLEKLPAVQKVFMDECQKLLNKKPLTLLSRPKEDMDGLVELTAREAQNSLAYKAAVEYLKAS